MRPCAFVCVRVRPRASGCVLGPSCCERGASIIFNNNNNNKPPLAGTTGTLAASSPTITKPPIMGCAAKPPLVGTAAVVATPSPRTRHIFKT